MTTSFFSNSVFILSCFHAFYYEFLLQCVTLFVVLIEMWIAHEFEGLHIHETTLAETKNGLKLLKILNLKITLFFFFFFLFNNSFFLLFVLITVLNSMYCFDCEIERHSYKGSSVHQTTITELKKVLN